MRPLLHLALGIGAALAITGCGVLGGDDGDFYNGTVTVALTDNVAATGQFVRQNVFNPNVREIIALVQVENAKEGARVEGRWYQMGVFGQKLAGDTPRRAGDDARFHHDQGID